MSSEARTFARENAHDGGCCVCNEWPHGALCRKHRRALTDILASLRRGLYELRSVALREEKLASDGGGASNPAFAPTPMDLAAQDLIDECEDVLQQVASDCGIWAGGGWQAILRKLPPRLTRLQSLRDYKHLANLDVKVRERLTPSSKRIIIGPCLNAKCSAVLSIVRGQAQVECQACGSSWTVEAVQIARRRELRDAVLLATPSEAASWILRMTGIHASRKVVNMWCQRGSITAPRVSEGRHRFRQADLLLLAETMKTRRVES